MRISAYQKVSTKRTRLSNRLSLIWKINHCCEFNVLKIPLALPSLIMAPDWYVQLRIALHFGKLLCIFDWFDYGLWIKLIPSKHELWQFVNNIHVLTAWFNDNLRKVYNVVKRKAWLFKRKMRFLWNLLFPALICEMERNWKVLYCHFYLLIKILVKITIQGLNFLSPST